MVETVTALPPLRSEEVRARELRQMKTRATAVLVVMTVVFVVVTVAGSEHGWTEWVRAGAEASMVGGLADWFAVTALFRHPLGLPIPHTAVIRERKDQFGETLGEFVQENFLTPDVVVTRLRGARPAERAALWLANRDNASTVAEHAADAIAGLADLVRDDDVHRLLEDEIAHRLERVPLAPVLARLVRGMTAQGRHHELLDAVLRGVERALGDNREMLRARFGQESPWWLPDAVEDRIFDRLLDGFTSLLQSVNADPDHEVRRQFDTWVTGFVDRLESSPEMAARVDELRRELLAQPELRRWTASMWDELKRNLHLQAGEPESELRQRLADGVVAAGQRLCDDAALSAKAEQLLESGVRYIAEHFRDEIAGLVSSTIARWDAEETSRKLELLLGRDLQFIRINGTVVGGIAGVAIHGVARLL